MPCSTAATVGRSVSMTEIAGLLLAAGGSERLGASKQLLAADGEALVRRQAALLQKVCDRVLVVTGAEAQAVESALGGLPVDCIHNPHWREGMGTSLAAGVAAAGEASALLVLLVDQWRIEGSDLAALCAAWRAQPDRPVAACWTDCDAGAPAIFPGKLFGRLCALAGDAGARRLLADPALRVVRVDVANAAFDLDTPDDRVAFEARFSPRPAGSAAETGS